MDSARRSTGFRRRDGGGRPGRLRPRRARQERSRALAPNPEGVWGGRTVAGGPFDFHQRAAPPHRYSRFVSNQTSYDLLRTSQLAAELNDEECRVLASAVTVRDFADGEVLVAEGGSDDHLYVIVSGAIAKSKRDPASGKWLNLSVLTHGDFAGELGFMDGKAHYAALRAIGPT